MGTITRAVKAGSGTGDYSTGTILASEVNADINTVYNEVNGNLDSNNLVDNAVSTAKMQNSAVTTAKIADSNVTTAKIADSNITRAKLASSAKSQAASGGATTSLSFNTTETDIATAASITTTGGRVLLFADVTLRANIAAGASVSSIITLRYYRDSTVIRTVRRTVGNLNASLGILGLPIPVAGYTEQPSAGSYVYKLTGEVSNTDTTLLSESTSGQQGGLFAVEVP